MIAVPHIGSSLSYSYFEPNTPTVISEVVDGQLVLVNFDSGRYYSANGSGTAIWLALDAGLGVEDITATLARNGTGVEQDSVDAFVTELEREGLVRRREAGSPVRPWSPPDSLGKEEEASAPTLTSFDDMAEMLLLDPIHDMDASGWPEIARDD